MRNEIKLALPTQCGLRDGRLPDAALHLSFVTTHRAPIPFAVEKAGALRRTATSPGKGTRDWKPIATGPGVKRGHQQEAGAGAIPAGVRGRWSGPECAPVIALARADCPSTRASASADRMTPAAQVQTSNRSFPPDRGIVSGTRTSAGALMMGMDFFVMAQKAIGGVARMRIETVAAAYAVFEQTVLVPSDYRSLHRQDAMMIFYAGAKAMMEMMMEAIPLDAEARRSRIRAILSEIDHYTTSIQAIAAAQRENPEDQP